LSKIISKFLWVYLDGTVSNDENKGWKLGRKEQVGSGTGFSEY
jgi:hypothetical protein